MKEYYNPDSKLVCWDCLSDEEKGKLLLAHHQGETIQQYILSSRDWLDTPDPLWASHLIYRVKLKKKKLVKYLHIYPGCAVASLDEPRKDKDSFVAIKRIEIEYEEGEYDE